MIETVIASGIGSAIGASFANQGLYNNIGTLNSKCDSIARGVSNIDKKCNTIASQMSMGFDSVMKTLNRLEIMQFLQLANAPTENGRITHTYDDGRKLSYVVDSQDILEYQADGQLAYKNGEELPVVTESFVDNGVEFKVVRFHGQEHLCSDALGYSVTKLGARVEVNYCGEKRLSRLCGEFQDVNDVKQYLDYASSCLDDCKNRLNVLNNELERLKSFGAIRRWWNRKTISVIKYLIDEYQNTLSFNELAVKCGTIHYDRCVDFSKKFQLAYKMLTTSPNEEWYVEKLSQYGIGRSSVLNQLRDGLMPLDEAVTKLALESEEITGSYLPRSFVERVLTNESNWKKTKKFRFVRSVKPMITPIKPCNKRVWDCCDGVSFYVEFYQNGAVNITFDRNN